MHLRLYFHRNKQVLTVLRLLPSGRLISWSSCFNQSQPDPVDFLLFFPGVVVLVGGVLPDQSHQSEGVLQIRLVSFLATLIYLD